MSSEPETQEVNEFPTETAPSLCYGTSPLEVDVGPAEACERYIYFKLLKQLMRPLVVWDDSQTKRKVEIYYYEDPLSDQFDMEKIPRRGIVTREVTIYYNEYGSSTQVVITLNFLPVQYTLV